MYQIELDDISEQPVSHNPQLRKRVLLEHTAIPGLNQFAIARFPPGECAPAHQHTDLFEVFLILAGSGHMKVDHTEIPLQEGSCIQVNPGEHHTLCNNGPGELRVLYFSLHATPTLTTR